MTVRPAATSSGTSAAVVPCGSARNTTSASGSSPGIVVRVVQVGV